MGMTDAKTAIRTKMTAEWSTTDVAYPNEARPWQAEGKQWPTDASGNPEPWVYLEVLGAGADSTVFGSEDKRVARDGGLIFAHVFVPVGIGDKLATQYAEEIGEIFRVKRFDGISTGAPSVGAGEQGDDDGLYWRVSVSIPFSLHYTA